MMRQVQIVNLNGSNGYLYTTAPSCTILMVVSGLGIRIHNTEHYHCPLNASREHEGMRRRHNQVL